MIRIKYEGGGKTCGIIIIRLIITFEYRYREVVEIVKNEILFVVSLDYGKIM